MSASKSDSDLRHSYAYNNKAIKVTIVGDGAVGKTSLLVVYTTKKFPEAYEPTIISYNNAMMKWKPELEQYCPKAKIVLVGTKIDLLECTADCITKREGKSLARRIKASKYVQCSAKLQKNVDCVFESAVESFVGSHPTRKLCCSFL